MLPGITHWNHPSFFAYFPGNTSYASILADLVASGLGAQGMSWQTSPAATEVEEVVMDWLRQMVGLSDAWTGVVHDTASTATLCALLCAREKASGFSQNGAGLQGLEAPLVVYASSQGHSSIEKAALLAGFGKDNLRLVDTDEAHALRVDLLEAAIAADRAAGRVPCALVACIGTTGTTAIDPLAGDGRASRGAHGLWLHVDAAHGGHGDGAARVPPALGRRRAGRQPGLQPAQVDGRGLRLLRLLRARPEHLIRVMSTNPSYLRTAQDGAVKNYRDWQIPLGRRFRALKLWFYLLDVGVEGLQARIRRDLANAQWLREQVDAAPDWERLAPVPLQTGLPAPRPGRARGRRARAHAPQPRARAPRERERRRLPHALAAEGPPDDPRQHRRRAHGAAPRRGACGRRSKPPRAPERTTDAIAPGSYGSCAWCERTTSSGAARELTQL